MGYRLSQLAELVGAEVRGDPDVEVEALRSLERAGPRDLSFLTHRRYRAQASASRAAALLVGSDAARLVEGEPERPLLVVVEPSAALGRLIDLFHPPAVPAAGVHPTAGGEEGASVDPTATVEAYVVVGRGARIEAGAWLRAHVVVGAGCRVGRGVLLHPHAVLYDGCEVGDGSVVQAGAVLGSDGFGYASTGGGHVKLRHVGRVVLEEGVEIGANTTVDRALLEETRLGAGSKLDNLVMVAHNVVLGKGCLLVSQAGIAGSTRLGDGVVMAGQSGAAGHLELGDGARVAAKSAVFRSVPAGTQVAGIPAVEAPRWRRQQALVGRLAGRLAELLRRLGRLEARLRRLEESGDE